MQFYEKLKGLRKGKGLTQEELAETLHVSRSAVAKWENGLGLPSEDSLEEIAVFFGIAREELLTDRETESIIVEKNGKIFRQKKWLITLITLACALLIAATVLLCTFLNRAEEPPPGGGGESVLTGITAGFNAEYETLNGPEKIRVYRLKTGERYEFTVRPIQRGSNQIVLSKTGVDVYYDKQLFEFDEGDYFEGDEREGTPTDEFPFYFTCNVSTAYTEIFVKAAGYWCKVNVIIEN